MEGSDNNIYSDERYFSPSESRVLPKNGISSETVTCKQDSSCTKDNVRVY
jgi:hypothetical protein